LPRAALVAIDKSRKDRDQFFQSAVARKPVTDFWEDLHDRGSGVEGGFCLIAQAYDDNNPLTNTLRSFRDSTRANTGFGRWLVDVYYGTVGSLNLHGSVVLRAVVGIALL